MQIFGPGICGDTKERKERIKEERKKLNMEEDINLSLSDLTWKSCDGRIIAVSLNQVICGLGFPSTWHSKCSVVPSCACLGCSFCMKRGAVACSPEVGSAMIPGN
jgi:hypothetical protein